MQDSVTAKSLDHITGHAQLTDAWLAELARRRNAKLATLDAALARFHGDVGFLIPE